MRTYLLLIVLSFLLAGLTGYLGFLYGLDQNKQASNKKVSESVNLAAPLALLKQQQASAVGSIEAVGDNFITLKGNGAQADFKLSPSLVIFPASSSLEAAPLGTRGKNALVVNKKVTITLQLEKGEYLVTTVTYLDE